MSEVGGADLVIVACPTFKGTYTGLLKLFLDRFAVDGIRGVAVPMMLGAGAQHALAPELSLRPVLTAIGATMPSRGLYVLDTKYDDPGPTPTGSRSHAPRITAQVDDALLHRAGVDRMSVSPQRPAGQGGAEAHRGHRRCGGRGHPHGDPPAARRVAGRAAWRWSCSIRATAGAAGSPSVRPTRRTCSTFPRPG